MTLRGSPIEETVVLPDGERVRVRVGVPDDPYVAQREIDTVAVELFVADEPVASVNTVLDADQDSEARALAREIARGLESGELELTAGAIEPLAERRR